MKKTVLWKKKGILIFVLFFISAVAYIVYFRQGGYSSGNDTGEKLPENHSGQNAESEYVVYTCGEVKKPGVYRFRSQVRLDEAIKKAGGFTKKADTSAINLAERIQDGQKITIPMRQASSGNQDKKDKKLSINLATKEELMTLAGIGESKADAILAYRRDKGSFSRIEDLMKISGIKKGVFEKIKNLISV